MHPETEHYWGFKPGLQDAEFLPTRGATRDCLRGAPRVRRQPHARHNMGRSTKYGRSTGSGGHIDNGRRGQGVSRSSGVPLRPRQQPPLDSPPQQPRCPVLGQVQDLPSSTTRNGTGQDLRWPPQHTLSLCVSSAQVHEQEARRGVLPLASKRHGCDTEAAAHGRATIGANRRNCGTAAATPYRFWP